MKCPSCGYVSLGAPASCKKCGAALKDASAEEHLFIFDEEQPGQEDKASGEDGIREGGWRVISEATSGAPSPAPPPPPPPERGEAVGSLEEGVGKSVRKSSPRRGGPRVKAEPPPPPPVQPEPAEMAETEPQEAASEAPRSGSGDVLDELFNFEEMPGAGPVSGEPPGIASSSGSPLPPPAEPVLDDFRIELEESEEPHLEQPAEEGSPASYPVKSSADSPNGVLPLRDPDQIPPSFAAETAAGLGPRFRAYFIDHLLIVLLILLFTGGAGAGLWLAGVEPIWLVTHFWPGDVLLPFFLLLLLLSAVYFVSWQWLRGSTPGMKRCRLRVVGREGRSVSLADALFRWLGYLVSTAPLGLGFIWALWDRGHLTWHDRLTGTLVVPEREARNKSA